MNEHEVCELKTEIACLKVKLELSDKALSLVGSKDDSIWIHAGLALTVVISFAGLVLQFLRNGLK